MKKLTILFGVLLFSFGIAAGLQWLVNHAKDRMVALSRNPAMEEPTPPPPFKSPPPNLKALAEARMITKALKCDATCTVKVHLAPVATDNIADLEGIRLDLALSTKKTILVSLEAPIEHATFTPLVKTVTPEQLFKGTDLEFRLKRPLWPELLGIFVCKDSDDKGHCAGKTVDGPIGVIRDALHGFRTSAKYQAPDKTYIFQFLLIHPEGYLSYFKDPQDEKLWRYRRVEAYVGERLPPDRRSELAQRMFAGTRATEILVSMVADFTDRLTLPLPYNQGGFLWNMAPQIVSLLPPKLQPSHGALATAATPAGKPAASSGHPQRPRSQ